jgi:hypothetical protein
MRNQNLAEKYPNLYISADVRAVWVLRDGRDGEAMGYGTFVTKDLVRLNIEAGKAIQPGWFYCKGCGKAKPKSEYSFFYFAGNYCKDCADADPAAKIRAESESYE